MSVTQSFWAQVNGGGAPNSQSPSEDTTGFWDKVKALPAPRAAAVSRFGAGYKAGLGIPSVKDLGTVQSNIEAAEHPLRSLEQSGEGLWQTYKGDVATGLGHIRQPGLRNKLLGSEEYLESAIPFFGHNLVDAQERANRGDTAGAIGESAGILTSALAPKAIHDVTPKLQAVLPKIGEGAQNLERGISTSSAELADKASGPLVASAAKQQSMLDNALTQAKRNTAPLYENLHAADEADNPAGAIELPEEAASAVPKQEAKSTRLTTGESQDLDRRIAAGSAAPTRRQAAASFASKQLASGMKDADVRQVLRNQYGFTTNQINAVMQDATAPSAEGGLTLAKARLIRSQIGRAANKAENAGLHREAAQLNSAYGQLTDAMRQRAADLGLGKDFDLADAKWRDIRSAEKILEPLTEAKEGEQPSPEKLNAAWNKLSSAQREELKLLARGAGLDTSELGTQAEMSGKVIKGVHPHYPGWFQRFAYGYLPARVGMAALLGATGGYLGRNRSSRLLRSMSYILPMALGYGGVGAIAPIMERGAAAGALEELPPSLSRVGYGRVRPTEPNLLASEEPPLISPPQAGVTPGREIVLSQKIGPRMQLPPYRGSTPWGLTLESRELPGMVLRPIRGLLPERNVTVLPSSGRTLVPGEMRLLPAANPIDLIGPRTPEGGIRTIRGKIVPPEWATIPSEETTVRTAEPVGALPQINGNELREERARLAELDRKYNKLTGQLERGRSHSAAMRNIKALRAISDERNALREKFGLSVPEGLPEERNPVATYDSLTDEQRESVDAWVKAIPHLPQSLREATIEELKPYGGPYTPLKERVAKQMKEWLDRKADEGGSE